jgi:hypothetical protein
VRLARSRGDLAPDSLRAALLVPLGGRASSAAIRQARDLADGGALSVLALLKIHGYALGLPNPGLLPTAKERAAQRDVVADAIARLERLGCEVDGQVASTRHPARMIASVARRRDVHHVIIERPHVSRLRRLVEGDVMASVRRRLGGHVEIVVIDAWAGPAVGAAPPPPG